MNVYISSDLREFDVVQRYSNLKIVESPDDHTDVLITALRGLTREEKLRLATNTSEFSIHLLAVPTREHDPANSNNCIESADPVLNRWGFILPGSGRYSLSDWLSELDAASILLEEPPPESLLEYASSRYSYSTEHVIQCLDYLCRSSYAEYQTARAEGRVVSVPLLTHSLESSFSFNVGALLKRVKYLSENLISSLPLTMTRTREKLQYLHRAADFQETDREIFVTGTFSSGKTTLLNAMIFSFYDTELPTAQRANTATTCQIKIKRDVQSMSCQLTVRESLFPILELLDTSSSDTPLQVATADEREAYVKVCRFRAGEQNDSEGHWFWIPYRPSELECRECTGFLWTDNSIFNCKTLLEIEDMDGNIKRYSNNRAWKKYKRLISDSFQSYLDECPPFFRLNLSDNLASVSLHVSPTANLKTLLKGHLYLPDNKKFLEDNAISWLGSEINIELPLRDELMCFDEVRIIDTPGFDSRHPRHDKVTRDRLSLAGPEDIILVLLRTSGSRPDRSVTRSSVASLRTVIQSSKAGTIIVLMNWRSSPEGNTTALKKDAASIWQREIHNLWNEEGRNGSPPRFFIADLLKTDKNELSAFRAKFVESLENQLHSIVEGIQTTAISLCTTIREEWMEISRLQQQQEFNEFVADASSIIQGRGFSKRLQQGLLRWAEDNELGSLRDYRECVNVIHGGNYSDINIYKETSYAIIKDLKSQHRKPVWFEPKRRDAYHLDALRKVLREYRITNADDPKLSHYVTLLTENLSLSDRRMYDPQNTVFLSAKPNLSEQATAVEYALRDLRGRSGILGLPKRIFNKVLSKWKTVRRKEIELVEAQISVLKKQIDIWSKKLSNLVLKKAESISRQIQARSEQDYSSLNRNDILERLQGIAADCSELLVQDKREEENG